MKIAVNTRLLLQDKLEGIGRYSYEVLSRLTKIHPEHEYLFIFDRPYSNEFVFSYNVTPIVVGPQARHAFLFYWWFEHVIPKVLKEHSVDLFFSPDGYLSLKTNVPQIQVIHDLAFEHFPEQVPFFARNHYKNYFPKYAQKAKHILTVSEFSKQDIIQQYGVDKDKITVAYNAASEQYKALTEDEKSIVRHEYNSGKEYLLYVGSINKRKNVGNLLKAFDLFCYHHTGIELLIVGEKMWHHEELESIYNGLKHKDRVVFTGRLPQSELIKVTASAYALVYVSLFEGFGLPIVEAMQCGVPVITSNNSSMKEIAGENALLINPESVDEISNAIKTIYEDKTIKEELVVKGLKRASDFSWDRTADIVGKVLFS